MNRVERGVLLVVALVFVSCQGETMQSGPGHQSPTVSADPFAPCTDPDTCCYCETDPDGAEICGCSGLWDCSENPNKCSQETPEPPNGGGGWSCTWTESVYTCEKRYPDGPGDVPPGGGSWNCVWRDQEMTWECANPDVPNPSNQPAGAGVWQCYVDEGLLVCERDGEPASPVTPDGHGEWSCTTTSDGRTVCEKEDGTRGLPEGGGDWRCSRTTEGGTVVWVCDGTSQTPPGGGGWDCAEVEGEFNAWRCEKADDTSDVPPGGGHWSCVKGSEFGGTVCEQVDQPPVAPTPEGPEDMTCHVGEKLWCDGLQYCGWGQVACDPATGRWKTKRDNQGNEVLDCQELSDGRRPNTVCACYHFYYNPACCERPDCIVPAGSTGQVCPKSQGRLCDYCNPQNPECGAPGARCVVTNSHESFCGQECSASSPCPAGYECRSYEVQHKTVHQCIPLDFSCYY